MNEEFRKQILEDGEVEASRQASKNYFTIIIVSDEKSAISIAESLPNSIVVGKTVVQPKESSKVGLADIIAKSLEGAY